MSIACVEIAKLIAQSAVALLSAWLGYKFALRGREDDRRKKSVHDAAEMKSPAEIKQCANSARAFQLGSQRCFEKRRISPTQIEGLPVPAIVCAAFAAELGIKALLYSQGDAPWGHDLSALFGKLAPATQDSIVAKVGIPRSQFDSQLSKIAKAFEKWRYVHDAAHVQIDAAFLANLAKVITDALPP